MTFIKSVLNRIKEFFQKIERKKLILIIAMVVVVLASGIIGAILLNKVHYTVLYSNLSAEEAGSVMTILKNKSVDAKAQGTHTIMVPQEQADELRIELASEGYPKTGLNYDVFSKSSSIGSTDLERQTYLQYQLQENMRATIRRMDKVDDCIVIVNLPAKSSFVVASNIKEASVSVMLSLKNNQKLSQEEAKTIGQFVLKCVPDLNIKNISIVDSKMNYYNILSDDSEESLITLSANRQKLSDDMKNTLSEQVTKVLKPAVGDGNLAVSVNLVLNFDKKSTNSVQFSPPVEGAANGLVRSSEEKQDSSAKSATPAAGQPGTDSNGVSASEYVANSGAAGTSSASSQSAFNYELNEIKTNIEKAQGTIENLSVAVLINENVNGISQNTEKVKNLVANAIGVNSKYISVELLPFVNAGGQGFDSYIQQNQEVIKQLKKSELIKTIVICAAILLALLAVFMFIRKRNGKKEEERLEEEGMLAMATAGVPVPADLNPEEEQLLKDIVIKKSNEVERVEELMDKYPDTVVQILRTWLTEER